MSLVAVVTDFGLADPYVAEMKLALWRHGPAELRVLDVVHTVPAGQVAAARWVCERLWGQLPAGSVLLAVVDPGVGTARPAVALAAAGRFGVGPGNGLLAGIASRCAQVEVVTLRDHQPPPGMTAATTFDGRDLFAPAAARLAGGAPLASLGEAATVAALGPVAADGQANICRVVWVDRFGNLITDLARDGAGAALLPPGATLEVAGRAVRGPVRGYGEAAPGELVWYWGSGGTLEIAGNRQSAAALLAAGVGLVIPLPRP